MTTHTTNRRCCRPVITAGDTISFNEAKAAGGGLAVLDARTSVSGSALRRNSAAAGGGVAANATTLGDSNAVLRIVGGEVRGKGVAAPCHGCSLCLPALWSVRQHFVPPLRHQQPCKLDTPTKDH